MKELLTRVFKSDLYIKPVLYSQLTPGSNPPAFRKCLNKVTEYYSDGKDPLPQTGRSTKQIFWTFGDHLKDQSFETVLW